MGRPVQNQGYFVNSNYLFDAEPQNKFEKIKIHAFLEGETAPSAWQANKAYVVGDKVAQAGKYYVCVANNTEAVFSTVEVLPSWEADTNYIVGDKVYEGGDNYICKEAHLSIDSFEPEKWDDYEPVTYWNEYQLGGGKIEDAYIIKQVGYNKYLVGAVAENSRQGIVTLVKEDEATSVGTSYITATDADAKTHSIIKLMKDKVIAYIDEDNSDETAMYTFNYNIKNENDGTLSASFEPASADVQVVLETLA